MSILTPVKKLLPKKLKTGIRKVFYTNPSFLGLANALDELDNGKREIKVYVDIFPMMTHPDEREWLYKTASDLSPKSTIVEIGCYSGGTAYFLGQGARFSNSMVYAIDPFETFLDKQIREEDGSGYLQGKPFLSEVRGNLERHGLDDIVKLIPGFSADVARNWNSGRINFLWIDGNHFCAGEDFESWRPHLDNRAIVAFHDTNYPVAAKSRAEVTRAVDNIIGRENVDVIDHCRSITALRMRD